MRALAIIVGLCCCLSVKAQFGQDSTVMILGGACALMPYQNRLKPNFSLDARRTLFKKKWIAVGGIRLGVEYRRVHRAGIGIYFLNTRVFDRDFDLPIEAERLEYDFKCTSVFYERALYFNRKWETGATFNLGGGKIGVDVQSLENPNEQNRYGDIDFSMAELSVYGKYNITYWIGVGAGFGYRFIAGATPDLRNDFSSPIFVANVQLKFLKLARSYFDESVKNEF